MQVWLTRRFLPAVFTHNEALIFIQAYGIVKVVKSMCKKIESNIMMRPYPNDEVFVFYQSISPYLTIIQLLLFGRRDFS